MDPESSSPRVDFLDGVRSMAACYVVLHHLWLTAYPDYRREPGPWFLQWLAFGYVAVAVFIVVSGFSLSLAAARHGWRLGHGAAGFFRRRAWRILPAYYAALVLSCLVFRGITPDQTGSQITALSVVVHALMVQDLVDTPDPNATFWSIAVECQIYLVFPLLLLGVRRLGVWVVMAGVAAIVLMVKGLSGAVAPVSSLLNLTPEFAVLFVMGMVAARAVTSPPSPRAAQTLAAAAGLLAGLVVVLCLSLGIPTVERSYFWLAFVVGGAVSCLLASLLLGGAGRVRAVLASRVLSGVGLFSYSIYLIHVPVLWLVWHFVVAPATDAPLPRLGLLTALCVPAVLLTSLLFFVCFERPFLTSVRRQPTPEEKSDVRPDDRPADLAT